MSFATAIKYLRNGYKVARKGWNGKNQYIILAYMKECMLADGTNLTDVKHSEIGSRFIMLVGTSGYQCGWLATQGDMLAEDWFVLDEEE